MIKPINIATVAVLSTLLLISCTTKEQTDTSPPVIEITARDYSFHGLPDTLQSGWTTFRLINEGMEPHFFLLDDPPGDIGLEEFANEAGGAFDQVWYQLRDGEIDKQQAGQMLVENLPQWYFETRQVGGTGMINAGMTAQTTLKLQPGHYIIECYVKSPEGEFHVSLGMADEFTVVEDSTGAKAPEADYEIKLTNSEIAGSGTLGTGEQTIAVHFEEHPEAGLGNDLHLARITDDTNTDSLKLWMDWMEVQGLMPPAPAEFLGGTQEMPVGNTAYFTVTLEPGNYAWLVETPGNIRMQEFSVAAGEEVAAN